MKSLINYWKRKLINVSETLEDYIRITEEEKLTNDMRILCISKIKSLSEYKQALIKTIEVLEKGCE